MMDFMKYALYALIGFFALIVFYYAFLLLSVLFINKKKVYEKASPYYRYVIDRAVDLMIFILGVKITVTHTENIPEKGVYLLVSNHISMFDPIVTLKALKNKDLVFIAKPSVFKLPFAGAALARSCFIPINRENPRKAVEALNRTAGFLESGRFSVGVYPEGTRSRTGELLPLHTGVFKPALKTGSPIVVCRVSGTDLIKKNFPLRKTPVTLSFVRTFYPEDPELSGETPLKDLIAHALSK